MTIELRLKQAVLVGILAFASMFMMAPAIAAQADLDLIQSYVGDWRGTGELISGDQPRESIRCRMGITKSSAEKINFSGRCAIAGTTLSMAGTMAYISSLNRYEAILSSNTDFSGNAVGRRRGKNVTFNLQSTNDEGLLSKVRAEFGLVDGNIVVNFIINADDGTVIVANVPFDRE